MFTLTRITEKRTKASDWQQRRRISLEEKHEHFIADSKVEMSVSKKIKANMIARNKIFGKHIWQFLHKNIV